MATVGNELEKRWAAVAERNKALYEAWVAAGRPVAKRRKPLTDEQKARRRARYQWWKSWFQSGDHPTPGHMRRQRARG